MTFLKKAAAAVNNHHAYPGGLLRHTVDLMHLARLVAPRYPQLDGELLMFGAFLHDLGKVDELAGAGEISYTDRGQLVGLEQLVFFRTRTPAGADRLPSR